MGGMFGYIYKTVNNINDKIYIGRHRWDAYPEDLEAFVKYIGLSGDGLKSFEEDHGFKLFPIDPNYIGSGTELLADVEKYGKENFYIIDILDVADTPQELKQKETEWIEWYIRMGVPMYNVLSHGYWGVYKAELSGEELDRYIDSHKRSGDGSRFGDCTGENNGHYGHHHTFISRQRISRSLKGRVQSEEERKMRSKAHNHDFDPPNHTGERVMHIGETQTYVKVEDIETHLQAGWQFGTGKFWVTDGSKNKMVTEDTFAKMDQTIWRRGQYREK